MSDSIRFVAVGAGFWSRYQLSAWREIGVTCGALCDRDRPKAEALARDLGIAKVYVDADEMLRQEKPAFVDVITTEESHAPLVRLAARNRVPVICQKPMAPSLDLAREMVVTCRDAGIPFAIHENFRFQAPMLAVKKILTEGRIGTPYRARIQMITGFPVFGNQPNLKELERFVISDLGSHILDLARFFFGDADRLFCITHRVHRDIRGEDAATVTLRMKNGASVVCVMGLAETPLAEDHFPETMVFVEGTDGSVELGPGCTVSLTTRQGSQTTQHRPVPYAWAHPDYLIAHASMVECNRDLLEGMLGRRPAGTNGDDNLKTMELVFGAYESARMGQSLVI